MDPHTLRQIAVLRGLNSDALAQLAVALEEKVYADGQTVFADGDPGDSMYFIARGRVRIEKRAEAAGAASKTLAVLEAGDYFGEMALLDQKPRSAAAIALGEAKLLRFSKASFDEIQRRSTGLGISVLFAMIQTSSERIRRLSSHLMVYEAVGKAIGEAPDLSALLEVILEQLSWAAGADWGLLLLTSQHSERIEVRAQTNLSLTSAQREAISNGQGFLTCALQNPVDQVVMNFEQEEDFRSCQRLGFETPSLMLVPVAIGSQSLGLVVLGGKEPGQFDLNSLNLARGVARQAGQAILNARHREEEQARSRHAKQFVRF